MTQPGIEPRSPGPLAFLNKSLKDQPTKNRLSSHKLYKTKKTCQSPDEFICNVIPCNPIHEDSSVGQSTNQDRHWMQFRGPTRIT